MLAEVYRDPKVVDYLRAKHGELLNDYRTPNGRNSELCSLIAIEVARVVLDTGVRPYLASIIGELLPDGINNKVFMPIIYEGRVSWGGHVVCCVEKTVLDPMVGEPLLIDDYRKTVFQKPVETEVFVTPEQIEEFLR